MRTSSRHEYEPTVQLKLPWEKNTAKGFGVAVISLTAIIFSATMFTIPKAKDFQMPKENPSVTLVEIRWGDGDGTGANSGDLDKKGKAMKGPLSHTDLERVKVRQESKNRVQDTPENPEDASELVPVTGKPTFAQNDDKNRRNNGKDDKTVGVEHGDKYGTGKNTEGTGTGDGMGFGDIDWGGGGNRTVTKKVAPRMPKGINQSAKITLRITVNPDGTVAKVLPMKKADPRLEREAIRALKKWRFNALSEDKMMAGIIPLTFIIR